MTADNRPHVRVHSERPDLTTGLSLRALQLDRLRGGLVPVNDKPPALDATGSAEVQVDPGEYVMEVLGAQPNGTTVSVHSEIVAVSADRSVDIPVGSPRAVSLIDGDESLLIEQLALRSVAVCDEARWTRHAQSDVPRVVLSPNQVAAANVVASLGSQHAAVWANVGEGYSPQLTVKDDWNRIRFGWREGTPAMKSATARIEFPAGGMEFPLFDDTQLITNRRFLMVGYSVDLRSGQHMPFRPVGRSVTPKDQLFFGGKLTPRAWAGFIWPENGGDPEKQLQWRVDLVDDGGQTADIYSQNTGVRCAIHTPQGIPVHDGTYKTEDANQLGDLSKALLVDMQWTWGHLFTRTLPVANFEDVRSSHFRMQSVPAWSWETRNYLTKLERYFRVERKATGRPGPKSIDVCWRDHTWNAKGLVGNPSGGGEWLWISIPFRTYEDGHDPYSEPHFLGHEMLHTFGYNHSDAMAKMQSEVERMFADSQWYMQDHPSETITILPATETQAP